MSPHPHPQVLLCSTAWKGSLTPSQVNQHIEAALEGHNITSIAMADGGDGWLEAIKDALPSHVETKALTLMGPVPPRTLQAPYLWDSQTHTAYVESAQIHGLKQLTNQPKAPMQATSYGVGEALVKLTQHHPNLQHIVVSVGGSASNDGGLGALQALGWQISDLYGRAFSPGMGGKDLVTMQQLTPPPSSPLQNVTLTLLVDVETTYVNAPRVFGAQKGASPEEIFTLSLGFLHVQSRLGNPSILHKPGSGAAGGLAGALMLAHPHLTVANGFEWTAKTLGLEAAFKGADLIISGEGQIDPTSQAGKGVGQLMDWAQTHRKPLLLVCAKCTLEIPPNPWVRIMPLYASSAFVGPEDLVLTEERITQTVQAALPAIEQRHGLLEAGNWATVCAPTVLATPHHPMASPAKLK